MSEQLKIFMITFIIGLWILISGVRSQQGHSRGVYLFKGFPGYPSGYAYAYLPISIGFLIIALAIFIPDRYLAGRIVGYSSIIAIILSIILMIWQPRWLKPWWLKWLEDNYGDIIEQMLEEARHTEDFAEITPDEDSLAAWASGVAYKYRH